jgi:hypothetical protein
MAIASSPVITLELPVVAYPRKVYFPEGAHSVLVLYTSAGILWTLVEDKQVHFLDDAAIAKAFPKGVRYTHSEVYVPSYFGIDSRDCFEFLRIQLRLSELYGSRVVYRHLQKVAALQCQMDLLRAIIAERIADRLSTH